MTVVPDQQVCLCMSVCVFTYRDNDGGDESPADFEEERRREAQHHLNVSEVVYVACDQNKKVGLLILH